MAIVPKSLSKRIIVYFELSNQLVLVGRHGYEYRLSKRKSAKLAVLETCYFARFHHVQSRLILVHRVQYYLLFKSSILEIFFSIGKTKIMSLLYLARITCPFWSIVLLVSFILWNNTGCFIHCTPVAGESG